MSAPWHSETGEHGLKKDAIGFSEGLVIALASTAPAYSLAAVIGSIVVIVGLQAPAALLVSFVPMFFIAAAFYYMNRADQDCGTSFSWVTRAIGPQTGWITGWAICVTGILVIGSLADVATYTFFDLVGVDSLIDDTAAVALLALALIAVMTWICILGTELSARLQIVLMIDPDRSPAAVSSSSSSTRSGPATRRPRPSTPRSPGSTRSRSRAAAP